MAALCGRARAHEKGPELPAAAPDGRTVRLVIDAEPQHLNPLLDPDLWGYRIAHNLLCEPLVQPRRGSSQAGAAGEAAAPGEGPARFEGVLAERFRIDSDGRGIDLWLRKGVRFHDGRPLTAYDVKATLEMVMRAAQSAPRTQALLGDVLRVLVVGKEGVHLDLRRATGSGRAILAALSEIDILPESQFPGGKLTYQAFNRRPVCTGPFRLAEWKRGSHLLLRRSPSYWGTPAAAEALRLTIAPDGARGLAYLRQGEADVLLRVAPRYLPDQVEPAVQRGRWRKLELDANQIVALVWNARHPALSTAAVRRALAAHIDRVRLVREVRFGLGTPLSAPLLGPVGGLGRPTEQDGARTAVPSEPATGQPSERALDAAGELLDAAGMSRIGTGSAGPRLFQGRPLSLRVLVPAGSTELAEVSRRIGDALHRAGLKWDTEVVDLATLASRLRQGSFDAALVAWSFTGDDSELDLEPLLRFALPDKHPLRAELSGAQRTSPSPPPEPAATQLAARWIQEQPVTLLYRTRQLALVSPAVRPLPLPTVGDTLDLRRIYLSRGVAGASDQDPASGLPSSLPSSLINSLSDSQTSDQIRARLPDTGTK